MAPAVESGGADRASTHRGLSSRLHGVSLTRRLVVVVVLLVLAAYVLAIAAIVTLLRDHLYERTDDSLRAAIRSGDYYPSPTLFADPRIPTEYVVMAYSPADDYKLFSSLPASMPAAELPDLPVMNPFGEQAPQIDLVPFTTLSADGKDEWRVIAGYARENGLTLVIALPLTPTHDLVAEVIRISVVVGLGAAVLVAAIAWVLVRRAFRPLTRIEDTAAAIAGGDLTRRVPEHPADDEVGSLSRSVNLMLARIEQSFAVREASEERMRRFVADASHELRTPLATVRGYAELYRQGGVPGPEELAGAMRRIEDEATRMARLVEDMLQLTRAGEHRSVQRVPVDLMVLANEAVMDARARDPERPLSVGRMPGGVAGRAVVLGDEATLRQVVTNLVANALNHTPPEAAIEVAVGLFPPTATDDATAGRAVLEVRDHGPGIPPEAADRVFERFFRADPSRGRGTGGGSGLGLAIVAAVVAHHGGTVRLHETPGGGATFRVDLPATRDEDSQDGEDDEL